ncbi:MAG: nucleotidyltransferase family protein [Oscillospiraceae bacterium]|nr:nucleotidyltransferase family protein [Oscillospiraceae bacterium]
MKTDGNFIQFSKLANASVREDLAQEEKQELIRLARELGEETLLAKATQAKMLPFLAKLMLVLKVAPQTWQPIYDRYAERNRQIIAELDRVYAALTAAGCRKLFVTENFGAMLAACGDTALFASGDVDNYVDAEEYPAVKRVMTSLGYRCEERFTGALFISANFEHPERLPQDFHFSFEVFPLSRLTQPCTVKTDDFTNWAQLRTYRDTAILLPQRDALLYICLLHISLHSFCRAPAIRLYRDIVNAADGLTDAEWARIAAQAKRDHTERRLYSAAYLSNRIAGTALPIAQEPKIKQLLKLVYDEKHGVLLPEPSRARVMRIEIASHDRSAAAGLKDTLFPDKDWRRSVYGSGGMSGIIRHLKRIV